MDEDEKNELSELVEGRIVNIFYLFSQAENYVKEVVADRQVLKSTFPLLFTPPIRLTRLLYSGPQGSQTDDSAASNYDAQVHQKPVDAVHDTRGTTFG